MWQSNEWSHPSWSYKLGSLLFAIYYSIPNWLGFFTDPEVKENGDIPGFLHTTNTPLAPTSVFLSNPLLLPGLGSLLSKGDWLKKGKKIPEEKEENMNKNHPESFIYTYSLVYIHIGQSTHPEPTNLKLKHTRKNWAEFNTRTICRGISGFRDMSCAVPQGKQQ